MRFPCACRRDPSAGGTCRRPSRGLPPRGPEVHFSKDSLPSGVGQAPPSGQPRLRGNASLPGRKGKTPFPRGSARDVSQSCHARSRKADGGRPTRASRLATPRHAAPPGEGPKARERFPPRARRFPFGPSSLAALPGLPPGPMRENAFGLPGGDGRRAMPPALPQKWRRAAFSPSRAPCSACGAVASFVILMALRPHSALGSFR